MLPKEHKIMELKKMKLFVDKKSTIDLANHPMNHGRNKHIEKRYHFFRHHVNKGKLKLKHYRSEVC